ncbi:MAG: TIGR03086 family metal-binding protein [Actinomycetota bacterium]
MHAGPGFRASCYSSDMDVISLFTRASESFDRAVAAIQPDHWTMPTPCSEWDVRALVNHVVGEDLWAAPMLGGKTIDEVGHTLDGDLLDDDPVRAWHRAIDLARATINAPGALETTVHASFGDISGETYVTQLFHDHLIHAWDLAHAIGADERMDPELVEIALHQLQPQEAMLRSSGAFGELVPSASDADTQTRLLALVGRKA